MRMTRAAFDKLRAMIPEGPPETGGILGGADGEVVSEVLLDCPAQPPDCFCSYAPNVDFLNGAIAQWRREGIRFMGLFHTHFGGSATLSQADREYIAAIMRAMPEEITSLYFPIYVLPERKLVIYSAKTQKSAVAIEEDYDLELTEKAGKHLKLEGNRK